MSANDDARFIAQLVIGERVHCVGDDAVMALAKRVLELEAELGLVKEQRDRMMRVAAQSDEEAANARGRLGKLISETALSRVDTSRLVMDEREACAQLFFDMATTGDVSIDDIAAAIRARGSK